MKTVLLFGLLAGCQLLAGCAKTRSISDSGYRSDTYGHHGRIPSLTGYPGELSEFDVLGINRDAAVSEEEIHQALDGARRVRLNRGDSVLLIQSGALFPDAPMVSELGKYFTVVPFSGVPPQTMGRSNGATDVVPSYSKSLRLAAARAGNQAIVCYWGILESAAENLATKTISWVPVVNWIASDERQHMRIRLKLAVIDVRSGHWTMLSPEIFMDETLSTGPRREVADQKQVIRLKQKVYANAGTELARMATD